MTRRVPGDSGMETTVLLHAGRDLPALAAFPLPDDAQGRDWLARYYHRHLALAAEGGLGFVLATPTRAGPVGGRTSAMTRRRWRG